MSEWYVSQVNVRLGDEAAGEPAIVAEEKVLTLKASYAAANRSYEVFRSLGTPNVGLYCWDVNKKSYAASLKAQKRRKAKKLTKADLAPALLQLAKEDAENAETSDAQEG